MFKLMRGLITGVIMIGAILVGGLLLTKNDSSEFAGIVDQLNPLVRKDVIYVKTQKAKNVNGYGTASYRQLAADKNGQTRTMAFNGLSELKVDHYLAIEHKGAHVETYREVAKSEVPVKALAQLD